jgi:protoheme IX farnesyltransferase
MSTVGPASPSHARSREVVVPWHNALTARLADYLELTKPRIAVLALTAVTVGYVLGSKGGWQVVPLLHALLGIGCVAAGSSILNQWIERSTDTQMDRTANRPLPAGRLQASEALWFGLACGLFGTLYLTIAVNAVTAWLALATMFLYVGVYTPLKRHTSLCTAVGAVPGALPPVLGWTAAGGQLDAGAFSLFAILFLWQFPHFLAIAWLYREDYARAGLRMLPRPSAKLPIVGAFTVIYALALIPVSLLPSEFALAGDAYFLAAIILGLCYLISSVRFLLNESRRTARSLLLVSLVYLPLLLLALTADHLRLLQ